LWYQYFYEFDSYKLGLGQTQICLNLEVQFTISVRTFMSQILRKIFIECIKVAYLKSFFTYFI
jgi:hypothetical protein